LPRDQAKAPLSTKSGQAQLHGFSLDAYEYAPTGSQIFCHFFFKPLLILHNMVVAARVCRSPDTGQGQTLANQAPLKRQHL
jgi:hypothetical protein